MMAYSPVGRERFEIINMRLVSIKIIAEILMTKQSTVYSWVHHGSIPFHRLNGLIRFDLDEIENWVKTSKSSLQCIPSVSLLKRSDNRDIDNLIKKAVDGVKGKEYNSSNGKPGQIQGLRKED
jgi:excisionase family DNA binding protein